MALVPLAPETRNLIDGQLVPPSNGATFENVNPATEEVIGVAADGTKDDMLRRDRRGAARLRRDALGDRPRLPREVPAPALRRARGGQGGAARDRRRRGRLAVLLTYAQCTSTIRSR